MDVRTTIIDYTPYPNPNGSLYGSGPSRECDVISSAMTDSLRSPGHTGTNSKEMVE